MTCIVGLEAAGLVHLGGDSAESRDEGETLEISDEPKVWVRGGCVWGGAGESRYLALAAHALDVPRLPRVYRSDVRTAATLQRWLTGELTAALRACWAADTELRPAKARTPDVDLLVGVRGRLYVGDGDGAFSHLARGYGAIGSGALPALGMLDALATWPRAISPRQRLARGLTCAAARTTAVRAPFRYVSG